MIKPIPGIMWAADVMTGKKPFPTYKPSKGQDQLFQKILDEKMKKIKETKE